ncbi:hypothetical protein [Aliiroseovarius lamellibrachiae]|uniref:hypothetical protein n=1 Tax=Aliiroseovarius lamellibrachiae TaxID=1924933 RepID=UPI001BE0D9F9|nr:hypothetical protein [Aliiroseovarius lamellibrachiae]MBT2129663.1 hypothetical protein [Aliiroseovarius lamellibrachiae]
MSETEKIKRPFWKNPIVWAIIATGLVAAFGFWAGGLEACGVDFWGNHSCSGTKWSAFLQASPNEVGDTLAGFAGALAFVWLIATVVLQGQELREQRLEFEKMADAQVAQLAVLEKQGQIFEDEQRQRSEAQLAEVYSEKLKSLSWMLADMGKKVLWTFSRSEEEYENGDAYPLCLSPLRGEGEAFERWLSRHAEYLEEFPSYLNDWSARSGFQINAIMDVSIETVEQKLRELVQLEERLGAAQKESLERLNINRILTGFERLKKIDDIWRDDGEIRNETPH